MPDVPAFSRMYMEFASSTVDVRFKLPADVTDKSPAEVDQVEVAPAVNVIAPEGVILQDVIPVSETAPLPSKSSVAVSSPYLLAPVPFIVTVHQNSLEDM